MKIGRNDPCPCGSGQKYKKCCLGKEVVSSEALNYRRLSEAHDQLVDRLVAYAARTFGEEAVHAAMHDARRARDLRRKIDARIGDAGRFQVDEILDLDAVMSTGAAGAAGIKRSREHEELMQHPEVREQLAGMFMKHWEGWVDQKIPALGGQSPRKAVKNSDGREAVEALLQEAEQDRGRTP